MIIVLKCIWSFFTYSSLKIFHMHILAAFPRTWFFYINYLKGSPSEKVCKSWNFTFVKIIASFVKKNKLLPSLHPCSINCEVTFLSDYWSDPSFPVNHLKNLIQLWQCQTWISCLGVWTGKISSVGKVIKCFINLHSLLISHSPRITVLAMAVCWYVMLMVLERMLVKFCGSMVIKQESSGK